jgi:hypothetical protein
MTRQPVYGIRTTVMTDVAQAAMPKQGQVRHLKYQYVPGRLQSIGACERRACIILPHLSLEPSHLRSRTAMSSSARSLSDLRHMVESGKYGNAGAVKGTCGTVRKWLQSNKDGYREFFRECYFPLVASVFGITSQGMLSHVGNRPAECDLLITFLRPGGTLFRAMVEVDAESLNHCRLPTSHLPVHTQTLLCTKSGTHPSYFV